MSHVNNANHLPGESEMQHIMSMNMLKNVHPYGFPAGGRPAADVARSLGSPHVHSMWKHTMVRTDHKGREEAFSIGPDGYVWSYFRNAEGPGAGRLMSTGLLATQFVLAETETGRAVVVAADGTNLRHVMEDESYGGRWTPPQETRCSGLRHAVAVEKLMVQTIGNTLFLAVLTRNLDDMGEDRFQLWEAVWAGDSPVFCHSAVRLTSESNIWMDELVSQFGDLML